MKGRMFSKGPMLYLCSEILSSTSTYYVGWQIIMADVFPTGFQINEPFVVNWIALRGISEWNTRVIRSATMCSHALSLLYLSNLLEVYIPSSTLRSSTDDHIFHIPNRRKTFQWQRRLSVLWSFSLKRSPFFCATCPEFAFKSLFEAHIFFVLILLCEREREIDR